MKMPINISFRFFFEFKLSCKLTEHSFHYGTSISIFQLCFEIMYLSVIISAEEAPDRTIKMINVATDDVTKVKKPKRVMLKLDLEKLFSDRGLSAIPTHINPLKFKGKGHELDDITVICRAYEHWAHRLYPKMTFKDVLEKVIIFASTFCIQLEAELYQTSCSHSLEVHSILNLLIQVEALGLKNRKKCFNQRMEIYENARRMSLITGEEDDDDDVAFPEPETNPEVGFLNFHKLLCIFENTFKISPNFHPTPPSLIAVLT